MVRHQVELNYKQNTTEDQINVISLIYLNIDISAPQPKEFSYQIVTLVSLESIFLRWHKIAARLMNDGLLSFSVE